MLGAIMKQKKEKKRKKEARWEEKNQTNLLETETFIGFFRSPFSITLFLRNYKKKTKNKTNKKKKAT